VSGKIKPRSLSNNHWDCACGLTASESQQPADTFYVLAFGDWARLGVGFATRLKLFQTFAFARKKKESGEVEIDFHSHVQLGRYATGVLQLTRGLHNSIVQEAWRAE
jgi:hypothetical protein